MDGTTAAILDGVAERAVPAAHIEDVDGWLLRRSPGLAVKRANSVLPRAHTGDLTAKLFAVESFYANAGLPARFQISPAAQPPRLKASLLARSYVCDPPVAVECCPLGYLDDRSSAPEAVEIASRPTDTWWATWQRSRGERTPPGHAVAALFARVRQKTAFVTVSIAGNPATAVLGVLEDEWLGIFNMTTLPTQRRRGAGRTALRALARWGRRRGARMGYLQVEVANQPARALYHSVGFREAYRYTYLSRCAAPPALAEEVKVYLNGKDPLKAVPGSRTSAALGVCPAVAAIKSLGPVADKRR